MNGQDTYNLNQNVADCLREVIDIGSTTVMNICTGTETVVPWGAGTWALVVTLGFAGVFLLLASLLFDR